MKHILSQTNKMSRRTMLFTRNVCNDVLYIQICDQANKHNWKFKKQENDTNVEKQICSLSEAKAQV